MADPKKDDVLSDDPPSHHGIGTRSLYTQDSPGRLLVDLLLGYKWPIVIVLVVAIAVFAMGWIGIPAIPEQVWGFAFYMALGAFPGIPIAYVLVRWLDKPQGQELLDIDAVSDDHRHLRVGKEVWDDLLVLSPWGEPVGTDSLKTCTINGESGYECMDFRVREDGTPVCVATWLGEDSSTSMRAYKSALYYARRRLQRQAQRASMMRANIEPLAREAAERYVYRQVKVSEKSGAPGGEEIGNVVEEVMDEFGVDDPLKDDEVADYEIDPETASVDQRQKAAAREQVRVNGHGDAEGTR